MGIGKRTLIADILHYPIWLTPLEKRVLGTPIFNRLHNVNQNSTAYLTFPSINHSRFSHSLGAMSLTGHLFYYGVINAGTQDLKKFLQSAKVLVEALCRDFDAAKHNILSDATCNPGDPNNFSTEFEEFSSLGSVIPHFLDEENKYVFATLLQALRLAALSHDLGHPPFSHVTEYALLDAKAVVSTLSNPNPKQRQFINCLKNSGTGVNEIYPHESLTLTLFNGLSRDVLLGVGNENKTDKQYCYAWLSLRMAANVLSEGSDLTSDDVDAIEVLRCLHALTAGDLDGDRFDYIQRDGVLAGIKDSGLRAERLIQLMQLTYTDVATKDQTEKVNAPRIVPNIRSLRSLEEYFSARFELYRSVIFHHHVVRTDGLFQSIVKDLTIKWLQSDRPEGELPAGAAQKTLLLSSSKSNIAWLWLIFDENIIKRRGQEQRNRLYLQWDDYWLLSLLRAMYIELHDQANRNEEDEILYRRLEELIASKRNYLSLVKRFEEFREIEISFFRELKRRFNDNPALADLAGEDGVQIENKGVKAEKELAERLLRPDEETAVDGSLRLANIVRLAADGSRIHEGFEQKFCEDVGTKDLLLVYKAIKPGFEKGFLVQTDSGPRPFTQYSVLAKELESKESRWPLFFAYVLKPTATSSPQDLRKALGKALAEGYIASCLM